MHDLVRHLSYEKGERIEGRLTAITPMELIHPDQRQKDLFAEDKFWQDEIWESLYVPGLEDTPVNFAYRLGLGQVMAIPYRVAAPMAWEYPYASGQLQESLTDRLVTVSLYGIQLVRPGYYSPQSGPEGYSESEWLSRKSQACANYVLDIDTSQCEYGPPQGSIGITSNEEEAFTCREEGCGAMPDMPCYFATAEQYTAHWNTFHVAVASTVICLVRGCGAKCPPGPDFLDAFFHHCKEKHEAESDGGQWRRLKHWARKGIDIETNPHYWAPTMDAPISPSQPSGVENLDAEDMKDPFKGARWVARTSFQSKAAQARPVRVRDSYGSLGPARGRGRSTNWGTGARCNRRAPKSSSGFESESQGELNPQTILEWGRVRNPIVVGTPLLREVRAEDRMAVPALLLGGLACRPIRAVTSLLRPSRWS